MVLGCHGLLRLLPSGGGGECGGLLTVGTILVVVDCRSRKSAAATGSSHRLWIVRLVGLVGQLNRWSVV